MLSFVVFNINFVNANELNKNAFAVGTLGVNTNNHTNTYFANGQGDGTSEQNSFQITNYEDLIRLSDLINSANGNTIISGSLSYRKAYYKLMNEISTNTTTWTPIGLNSSYSFSGTFDGGGHTVTFKNEIDVNGFFRYVSGTSTQRAYVKKLCIDWEGGLSLQYFDGAGIIYNASYTTISSCFCSGSLNGYEYVTGGSAAGIVSSGNNLVIEDCFNSAILPNSILEYGIQGGIIGSISENSTIKNCYNLSAITTAGDSWGTGGIVGAAGGQLNIYNCFDVGANSAIVGRKGIGWSTSSGRINIYNCYTTSSRNIVASNGFNTNITVNINSSQNNMNQELFQDKNTFTTIFWNSSFPWELEEIWVMDSINEGYPYLRAFYKYTVTYDTVTNGGSISPNNVTVDVGENVTLPIGNFKDGWNFLGWSDDANATTEYLMPSSIYTPTSNVTLYAIFSKEIIVNFYQLEKTMPTKQSKIIYNKETNATFTIPSVDTEILNGVSYQDGSLNMGWATTSGSEEIIYQSGQIQLTDSANLYAVIKYNVVLKYNSNGGVGNDVTSQAYTVTKCSNATTTPVIIYANSILNTNTFTRKNYSFIGWSTNKNAMSGLNAGENYTFDRNTILYAIWKLDQVNVTFNITTNLGVILTISDDSGNVQQVFIDKGTQQQTFALNLNVGQYKIAISTFYTTNIELLTANDNQVLSGKLLTLNVVGGEIIVTLNMQTYVGSNWIII